jgi:hypothetical protein
MPGASRHARSSDVGEKVMRLPLTPSAQAPRVNSRLVIELEREVGAIAHRIHGRSRRLSTAARIHSGATKGQNSALRIRNAVIKSIRIVGQKAAVCDHFLRRTILWVTGASRSIAVVPNREASLKHARERSRAVSMRRTMKPTDSPHGNASKLEIFLISALFGLLVISVIIVAMLLIQIKYLKIEIAQIQRTTMARLEQVEKVAKQRIVVQEPATSEPAIPKKQPQHIPFVLSEADQKLVRQFIKTFPSKPGVQQKIQLGDKILDMPSVPVPDTLVERLPKLRGARFSIDQNGAIIIIREGSGRADAMVAPNE